MSFNLTNFRKAVPPQYVDEGEKTFKMGGVKKIDSNKSNEWIAEVQVGNEVFNVEIMIDDEKNILDHFCDCPSETEHCRHQVAAFLKLKEVLPLVAKKKEKAPKPVIEKKKKLTPVETILSETTLKELQDFIRKASAENKLFQSLLLMHFANKTESNNRKYYTDVMKNSLSSIKRNGHLGKGDSKKYLKTIEDLENKAIKAYTDKQYKEFSVIALAFLELLVVQLERLDDSDYRFQKILQDTLSYLGKAINETTHEIKAPIIKEAFEVIGANIQLLYNKCSTDLLKFFKVIGNEPDLASEYSRFLDEYRIKQKDRHSYWGGGFSTIGGGTTTTLETELVDLKRAFLEANGKSDMVQKLLSEHLNIKQYKREHIQYLMDNEKFEDARIKIEKDIFNRNDSIIGDYVDVMYLNHLDKIYEVLNDKRGQVKIFLLRFRLGEYKQYSILEKIKSIQSPAEWEGTFQNLIKEIKDSKKPSNFYGYGYPTNPKLPISVGHLFVFDNRLKDLETMVAKNDDFETYGAFAPYLLANNFEKYHQIFEKNLLKWFQKSNYNDYEGFVNILVALQDAGKPAEAFLDSVIKNLKNFHTGKRKLIEMLYKAKIKGF
jgi:hypothetical protein